LVENSNNKKMKINTTKKSIFSKKRKSMKINEESTKNKQKK